MTCGIYLLRFTNTDKVYIGQSLDIEHRYTVHKSNMKTGKASQKLQEAYKQYGIPSLEILCECSKEDLNINEDLAIEIFDSVNKGFNTKDQHGYRMDLKGENSPSSTISNEDAREILFFLTSMPQLSQEDISIIVEVSVNVVKDISCGNSHRWLKDTYPEEYTILENMQGKRNAGILNPSAILSEDKVLKVIDYILSHPNRPLTLVAKSVGVSYPNVKAIATGRNHSWIKEQYPDKYEALQALRGTRIPGKTGKTYPQVRDPEGNTHTIDTIKAFARLHNLNDTHLGRMLRGLSTQHKGWTLA